jgi:hypothetical protein
MHSTEPNLPNISSISSVVMLRGRPRANTMCLYTRNVMRSAYPRAMPCPPRYGNPFLILSLSFSLPPSLPQTLSLPGYMSPILIRSRSLSLRLGINDSKSHKRGAVCVYVSTSTS